MNARGSAAARSVVRPAEGTNNPQWWSARIAGPATAISKSRDSRPRVHSVWRNVTEWFEVMSSGWQLARGVQLSKD